MSAIDDATKYLGKLYHGISVTIIIVGYFLIPRITRHHTETVEMTSSHGRCEVATTSSDLISHGISSVGIRYVTRRGRSDGPTRVASKNNANLLSGRAGQVC